MKIMDKIFGDSMPGLHKALDISFKRGEAIVSNIANAETPGYKAIDLEFGNELKRAFDSQAGQDLKVTNSKHMDVSSNSGARLVPDYSGATKADGNNVDLDIMMTRMQMNQGRFVDAAGMLRKKVRFLMTAIRSAER